MARLNIEDSLFRDDSFLSLVEKTGCRYKSIGMVISAFILAQRFWSEHRSIPSEHWPNSLNLLIECGFVRTALNGNSVYVRGSEKQFGWLDQKSAAGKSVSEKKLMSLKKARDARWNKKASDVNGSERNVNGSEALTLTLTPTLTLSNSNNTCTKQVLSASELESAYQKFPRKQGKSRGLARARVKIKSRFDLDRLNQAIENYTKHCSKNVTSAKYIKQFDTFMSEWEDWLDPETGTSHKPTDSSVDDEIARMFEERDNASQRV